MPEQVPKEKVERIQQKMRQDPRVWMRNKLRHPNDPRRKYDFRTNDGTPIRYLADDDGPLNPDEWASINVLLMARGCLKTTSVLGATGWGIDQIPQFEAFMTAPREDPPIDEFVDKFRNFIEDTELERRRVKNNKSHQKFKTKLRNPDTDEEYSVHSHLKTMSAWGEGEGLRGPHSHMGIIDEFQDVDESSFSVFLEVIDREVPSHDEFPVIWIIGTPKLKNTFFHELWKTSNQRQWDIDEGEWVDHQDVGEYAPEDYDGDPFTVKAWHVDQYNSPLHDPSSIEFKREKYSEKRFKNEVQALFYSPEDDLLTDENVRNALDEERGFRRTRLFDDSTVVLTVDWGGGQGQDASDTTIVAAEQIKFDEDDGEMPWQIQVHEVNFVDHDLSKDDELDVVRDYISDFDPTLVGVDEGYAGNRREALQEEYGADTVIGIGYGNVNPSEDVRWGTDADDEDVFVTVDKSYCADNFVDTFSDGQYLIPADDLDFGYQTADGTKLIKQLTAPYKEFKTTPSGTKKLKILSDRNDDAFDAFVYTWICAEHVDAGPQLMEVGANELPYY